MALALVAATLLGAAALELPRCDVFTLKYLGESGRTCLHLDAERPVFAEDGAGNRTCADTPSWTDGTNGEKPGRFIYQLFYFSTF